MTTAFGNIAKEYDDTFTTSQIGRAQRNAVRKLLKKELERLPGKLNILEINCGTGADAEWMASSGHSVLATDISEEMIAVANAKSKNDRLEFKVAGFSELRSLHGKKFDLVFSNFGGLNCINKNELQKVMNVVFNVLLSDSGKFIAVIMPDMCLWEKLFVFSRRRKNRNRKIHSEVTVGEQKVKCWYYSPADVKNSSPCFTATAVFPIGFFIPPSYFEGSMKKKRFLFSVLVFLEKWVSRFTTLSRYSDHFYISLEKK